MSLNSVVLMATPCPKSLQREGWVQGEWIVDDVDYYICWRLKLEGETENMGVQWAFARRSGKGAEGRSSRGTHGHSLH